MNNILIIAGAGSGKTTHIVEQAIKLSNQSVLITTYTEANEQEIKNKFIKKRGSIPPNVTIQTWFSFLIQHGVRPYQSFLYRKRVKGLLLVNKQSGLKYMNSREYPVYYGEDEDFEKHYFSDNHRIYSDKLSKFVYKVNKKSHGRVIKRISDIYSNIFLDESQDLAGYDLSLIKLLGKGQSNMLLVCDPRQVTYLTHLERKFKKYRNGRLAEFIENECSDVEFAIDEVTLSRSHRCNESICAFSNSLYSEFKPCESAQNERTGHDGVFLVEKKSCLKYLMRYNPVQLRWDRRTKVYENYNVLNFGLSKGLTFDRVLIYPTKEMLSWVKNRNTVLSDQARAKFYVAITRAKYSVGLVCDNYNDLSATGIEPFG